jgi:hypothetical protein
MGAQPQPANFSWSRLIRRFIPTCLKNQISEFHKRAFYPAVSGLVFLQEDACYTWNNRKQIINRILMRPMTFFCPF